MAISGSSRSFFRRTKHTSHDMLALLLTLSLILLERHCHCASSMSSSSSSNSKDLSEKSSNGKQPQMLLTVQIVNATSLTLRWLPPKADAVDRSSGSKRGSSSSASSVCPVQRYIVRLRQDGQKGSPRAWRLDGDRQTVTLHDLRPSTGYHVRLMTITCDGRRKSSRWVALTTADLPPAATVPRWAVRPSSPAAVEVPSIDEVPDGPPASPPLMSAASPVLTGSTNDGGIMGTEKQAPGPPTTVRTRTSSESVVVTWSPPEDSALIRGYMIGYGEGVPDVNWRYVSPTQRDVTIHGLKSSTQYVISVRALNNFGKGQVVYDIVSTKDASVVTSNLVGGGLPSPTHLRSKILSSTTAWLHWTDPSLDSQQKITDERYYNVYYQALPNSKNLSVIVKALHVTIYDLLPNKVYQFKVRTIKGALNSPFSESITNRTTLDTAETGGTNKAPVKSPGEYVGSSRNASVNADEWEEYDYDDETRSGGHIENVGNGNAAATGRPTSKDGGGWREGALHAEVKKKRAHSVVQESLARTLLTSPTPTDQGTAASPAIDSPKVAFRSMVQHRVSAYVTWPERLAPCPADAVGGVVAGYIFRYKAYDDVGDYTSSRNLAVNFVLLENLQPNAKYKYQVKYILVDRGGAATGWSQEATLDTHYYPDRV